MNGKILICISFLTSCAQATHSPFQQVQVSFSEKQLNLELANTDESRSLGLMYREQLCANCGMIFEHPQPRVINMWMKNTLIPLDVAFLDAQGQVIVIKPMQPLDLTIISSEQVAGYAWEMNQGWFTTNKVKVGDRIEFNSVNKKTPADDFCPINHYFQRSRNNWHNNC